MSEIERIDSLRAKHAALDDRLKSESQRPLPNEDEIHRLKREKLRIKDEIARLSDHPAESAVA